MMLQHPEIDWIERTGYPSWMQEEDNEEGDEDRYYEEQRDSAFDFWGE